MLLNWFPIFHYVSCNTLDPHLYNAGKQNAQEHNEKTSKAEGLDE
jgi:hypothetical protein